MCVDKGRRIEVIQKSLKSRVSRSASEESVHCLSVFKLFRFSSSGCEFKAAGRGKRRMKTHSDVETEVFRLCP